MDTQEKKAVLKVTELLGELATAWGELPSDIQEYTVGDLQILGMASIRDLAQRLTDMTKGYTGNCEFCGKPFTTKGKGSKQRFCCVSCRVQANRKEKSDKWEAERAARDNWEL